MTWSGDYTVEPPPNILHVKDEGTGNVMDRVGECQFCPGGWWRWRHNRGEECWMDMDGIGPFTEWGDPS
jgi:hypothetical protein